LLGFRRNDYKITSQSQFSLLYASGKRAFSKSVTLFYVPNTDGKRRMAFVAGKKVGGSVVRNRCKRLIREAVRLNQDTISNDYIYMFVAKPELSHRRLEAVEKELCFLFKKHALWV